MTTNKDGQNINTKREILLLILRWLSSRTFRGKLLFPFSVMGAENRINKIGNFFKNNILSRFIIDAKAFIFGSSYPEFIFSDENDEDMYVHEYDIVRLIFPTVIDFEITNSSLYAENVSKMFFIKKIFLLKVINSNSKFQFRIIRILEFPKK